MKLLQTFCSVCLIFMLSGNAQAKLTCDFSADTLKGCAPLRVSFTDLSSGGGTIIYRNWDFGNGGFSNSNNPAPSRVYATNGQYTVTLYAMNNCGTPLAFRYFIAAVFGGVPKELNSRRTSSDSTSLRVCSMVLGGL